VDRGGRSVLAYATKEGTSGAPSLPQSDPGAAVAGASASLDVDAHDLDTARTLLAAMRRHMQSMVHAAL
jgi:hypothetical protein